ncbi:MAG: hypothetical protein CMJ86_07625 [Planctomycetes bacterium]|nr:hypothetical protein [Planctomycetota bacterium]
MLEDPDQLQLHSVCELRGELPRSSSRAAVFSLAFSTGETVQGSFCQAQGASGARCRGPGQGSSSPPKGQGV